MYVEQSKNGCTPRSFPLVPVRRLRFFQAIPVPVYFPVPFLPPIPVAAHFPDPFRSDPLLATVNQKPSNADLNDALRCKKAENKKRPRVGAQSNFSFPNRITLAHNRETLYFKMVNARIEQNYPNLTFEFQRPFSLLLHPNFFIVDHN